MPQRNTPTKTKRLTHCFPVARTFWHHGNSSWKRVFLIVLPSAPYSGLITTRSFLAPVQNAFKWLKPSHPLTKVCALVNSKFLLQRLICLRIKLPSVVITVHMVWLESLKFITRKCRGWVRKKRVKINRRNWQVLVSHYTSQEERSDRDALRSQSASGSFSILFPQADASNCLFVYTLEKRPVLLG